MSLCTFVIKINAVGSDEISKQFRQGHALVIGVGADLPNTVDDALGLAGILQDAGRCAYPQAQVQVLTAESATRSNILAALDTLAQRVDADATVVVYFSGHGYQVSTVIGQATFFAPVWG